MEYISYIISLESHISSICVSCFELMMFGDIMGQINFCTDTTDGCPPRVDVNMASGQSTLNFGQTSTRVTVYDLRGKEMSTNLDINGFELLKYEGHIHDDFREGSEAQQTYFEEIVALLKKRLTASRAVITNQIFRSRGPIHADDQSDSTCRKPVFYPHVDFDTPAAHAQIEQTFGKEEAEKLMQNRFQVINVWRPLGPNAIMDKPLAVCDYRSLNLENDVHRLDVRGFYASSSGYVISHNAQDSQKWYYLSQMRSSEMFLIKNFDSKPDVAKFAAHTAFPTEHIPPSDDEHKSTKVRCLLFYDE